MSTPNGTLTGPVFVSGVVVKDDVRPTQAALNEVWDRLGILTTTIDQLSNRLKPALCPAPIGEGCCTEVAVPTVSPLTVEIQRIGDFVASAEGRLAELIGCLDL